MTRRTRRTLRGGDGVTTLRIQVFEHAGTPKEAEFETSNMSGQEQGSIQEMVEDLLGSKPVSGGEILVDVDGEGLTLIHKSESGDQVPFPADWIAKYANKRFGVRPEKFGMNEWGHPVQVQFTPVPEGGRRKKRSKHSKRSKRVTRKTRRV